MELVHVPPSSSKPKVSLLDKEHLAHQGGKVLVVSQKGVEALVGLPPKVTPFGGDGLRELNGLTKIVVDGDVHDLVTIPVACDKFILQALHLCFNDRPNKGQDNYAAEKDADSRLLN